MSKEVIFSTGNSRKITEATEACSPYDINIIQAKLEIDEIQSHEPEKIGIHKAKTAYEILKKPVVINDSFWSIPALNGFPGGYMKEVAEWFTAEDFINLMKDKSDKRICLTECIVYKDEETEHLIVKEFWGEFSKEPKGTGNSIEQVAIFNGMTLGQHYDNNSNAYDSKDYIWNDFAEWFIKYDK